MKNWIYLFTLILISGNVIFSSSKQENLTPIAIFLPDTPYGREHGTQLENKFQQNTHTAEIYYSATQLDQNSDIESHLSDGFKIMIIHNLDSDINIITPQIVAKGIQIITYDSLIENNRDYFFYLTFDYELMGKTLADKTVQKLPAKETPYNFLIVTEKGDKNQKLIYNGIQEVLSPYIRSGRLNPLLPIEDYKTLSIKGNSETVIEAEIDKLLNLSGDNPDIIFSTNDLITEIINDKLDLVIESEQLSKNLESFAQTTVMLCNQILNEDEIDLPETRHYKTDTGLIMVDTYFINPNF